MDKFIIHAGPLPRRFPTRTQVQSIGYVPHKDDYVDHPFDTFNFSFILRGRGAYRMDGRDWSVIAPCVITQWPGVHVAYGPETTWEELYLVYNADCQGIFEGRRFAVRSRPVWYIRDIGPTRRILAELRDAVRAIDAREQADVIDRLCDRLILESLIAEDRPTPDPTTKAIYAIRADIREQYRETIDYDELALDYGFSPATFRRHWRRLIGIPPAQYVTRLRMRQACRLLVETNEAIGNIALALGYEDPLYFSRRFKQEIGMTATDYRERHHTPLTLSEAD